MRRPVLSDEWLEQRLASREKLQYSLTIKGPLTFYEAEIIGPFGSEFFGRSANGPTPDKAIERLKAQLERLGFIGRLDANGIGRDYSDEEGGQ